MGGNIAIIGGTGMGELPEEIFAEPVEVQTRHGVTRVLSVSNNYVEPYKLYFMARHGAGHRLAPHQIDYRANIAALVALEVRYVYATNAVGSLRLDLPPGDLMVLNDFIDVTRGRSLSYFEEGDAWQHTDFSSPYSSFLRAKLIETAIQTGISVREAGTYLCCDGPRFESPAEVRLFGSWGADVVGMTGLPEAIFAREAGLEYAALAIVTNYGAGLTSEAVDHQAVEAAMANRISLVRELLMMTCGAAIEAVERGETV